jgi:serine protease Do
MRPEEKPPMTRTPRPSRRINDIVSTLAIASALGFGLGYSHQAWAQEPIRPGVQSLQNGAPASFADLIERVSPAVVSVSVTTEAEAPTPGQFNFDGAPPGLEEFFKQLRPDQDEPPPEGKSVGSGFLISADGYIVTNNHVVDHPKKVVVTLKNGDDLDADIVGVDENTDLAVLKVKHKGALPFVEFETSAPIRVGDWVVALGNPFGLGGTATAGIISASGRDIGGSYNDFLQIDAPINRGNSGGPTFDLSGRVIGVNSQIFSPSGGNVGIGFAIPAQTAARVVNSLISQGHVTRGWLGVSVGQVTPEIAASMGLKDAKGAIISDVNSNGPADKAGFKVGDVVLAVEGQEVKTNVDLTRKVGDLAVGEHVHFRVFRDNQEQNLTVTIGERPTEQQLASMRASPGGVPGVGRGAAPGTAQVDEFGMTLSGLDGQTRQRLHLDVNAKGVLIQAAKRSGQAAEQGLSVGDVILEVAGQGVSTPGEFATAVQQARKGGRTHVLLLVQTEAGRRFVALSLGGAG